MIILSAEEQERIDANRKWATKDGKSLFASEMADEHLINALRMILRKVVQDADGQLSRLYGEGRPVTGMLRRDDAYNMPYSRYLRLYVYSSPVVIDMYCECFRRNLDVVLRGVKGYEIILAYRRPANPEYVLAVLRHWHGDVACERYVQYLQGIIHADSVSREVSAMVVNTDWADVEYWSDKSQWVI